MSEQTQGPGDAVSAERAHAYKMGGRGREYLVDALAAQLHHNESLHLHTLPGDEGEACRYCYLRAGRSVGALAPAPEPELITTAEQVRALPIGTVLLDLDPRTDIQMSCQIDCDDPAHPEGRYLVYAGGKFKWPLDKMPTPGPFRVLHTPVVPDGR